MLNDEQKTLLYFLKCAAHDQKADEHVLTTEYPSFSWSAVMEMARAHNILPLIFSVAEDVKAFQRYEGYEKLTGQVMAMVAGQIRRTRALLSLYQTFAQAKVSLPVVMKGIVCRQLYGDYEDYRPSWDEDLLVKKEDFYTIGEILEKQGFVSERPGVTTAQLEELQEVCFYDPVSGLCVELHVNPVGHENLWRMGMNDCFADIFDHTRTFTYEGTELSAMDYTEEFLFLVFHAAKHFSTCGIGLRQVTDILLYAQCFAHKIRWDWLWDQLDDHKCSRFLTDVFAIGEHELGFSIKANVRESTCCPQDLLSELFWCGVFGNATQEQRTAQRFTSAAVSAGGVPGLKTLSFIRGLVFPGRHALMGMHPELAEKPWLLPIFWVKRWRRFLKHNRQVGGGLAGKSIAIGQRRTKLLKKYGLVS